MHSIKSLLLSGAAPLARAQFSTTMSLDTTSVSHPNLNSSDFPVATTDDAYWPATTVAPPLPDGLYDSPNAQGNSTACTPRPPGYGPAPFVDNTWAFYNFPVFKDISLNAPTPTNWARAFVKEKASSKAIMYLGYSELESYDTNSCSARCDQIDGCKAINIYFERTPTLYLGYKCQDAPGMTVIKCVFWGEELNGSHVTNWGHRDWKFDVVMAGSNGYNRERLAGISAANGSVITTVPALKAVGLAAPIMVMLGTVLRMLTEAFF